MIFAIPSLYLNCYMLFNYILYFPIRYAVLNIGKEVYLLKLLMAEISERGCSLQFPAQIIMQLLRQLINTV